MAKEKLKEALKKAGLKEGLAKFINITSEDEIEGIIEDLKSTQSTDDELDFEAVLSSDAFKAFVDKNGIDKVVEQSKTLKSGFDKKVTTGINTFKSKYIKKLGVDDDDDDDDDKGGLGDDSPAWAKKLFEKMNNLETKSKKSESASTIAELLSKSKLPKNLQEKWSGRVISDSETSIEDQIKALEEEHIEIEKSIIGEAAGSGLPIGFTKTSEEEKLKQIETIGKDFVAKKQKI